MGSPRLVALAVVWVACVSAAPPLAVTEIRGRAEWLYPADRCPADVLSAARQETRYLDEGCRDRVAECLASCKEGDGADCYALALVVEGSKLSPDTAQALFLRACALGIDSGCTNRAAGLDAGFLTAGMDVDACVTRTFDRVCTRGDAWACTMFGFHLYTGRGIARDWPRALAVLPGGCAFGEDDPACQAARVLVRRIQEGVTPGPAKEGR